MFGSSPQPGSPRFSGGIGDFLYGSWNEASSWTSLSQNLVYAYAPNCLNAQIFPFNQPDLYKDTGCFKLDALAVGEQVFGTSENINTPVGTLGGSLYFPLISFRPLEDIDRFQTVNDDTQVLVPHFPYANTMLHSTIGMVFRFRPTVAARMEGRHTFAQSRLLSGPPDAFALQAGTIWNNDEFRFFLALPVGNTGEMQTMEAILHTPSTIGGPEFDFCEECVWTVFVTWTMRTGSDVVNNNLIMHHLFQRNLRQTIHTTQAQILYDDSSPLTLGVDKVHQMGQFQSYIQPSGGHLWWTDQNLEFLVEQYFS